jgi:uncharacterized protein YceH (UPF0502 family)
LSGEIDVADLPARTTAVAVDSGGDERMSRLENEIAELRSELSDLKQEIAAFRKQFE